MKQWKPDTEAGQTGRGAGVLSRAWLAGLALCVAGASLASFVPARAQTRAEFVPTFSTNTRVKQQIERLARLAQQQQWDDWITGYQALVDDPRDLVISRDEEFLVGVRWHCHQILANLPAQVRQKYRAKYDGEAKKLYDEADKKNDATQMRAVYSRFRFTSQANRALQWIANRALDEGRPELARVAYSRLVKDAGVNAGTLLRYTIAASAAGKPAEAKAALDRVRREFGGQPLQLAGKNTTGGEAADALAKVLKAEADAPGEKWESFTGSTGDRRMTSGLKGGLKRLWEFSYPAAPEAGRFGSGQVVQIGGGYSGSVRNRYSFLTFPLVKGDQLLVQGPRNLAALDLKSGKPAWEPQDFLLTPEEYATTANDQRSSRSLSTRAVQAAPCMDGNILVTRMAMAAGDRAGNRWPVDFAIGAFDTRQGRPLWRKIVGGEPRGQYYNAPTLQSNVVITGSVTNKGGITEYNAVALDAGTGEPLWTTYLGAGSDPLTNVDGSPAAVRDGLVWIESSLYTLNALDLITGEIRLIYRYDPGRRAIFRSGFDSAPTVANEPISAIAFAPRIKVEGRDVNPVVFVPRWGIYAVAIDPESGKLIWASPKAPGQSALGALFAVDQQHVYICADHVQAINLADGSPAWSWEPQAPSSSIGFAALAGDRIFVPIDGKIYIRSAVTGNELETLDVTEALGDSSGFAGLVVVGDTLFVTLRDRVVAFGPK